jgi:hypothetical protein
MFDLLGKGLPLIKIPNEGTNSRRGMHLPS